MDILIQTLQLLACLSLLVIVHEFGHFITAKIFGVRVEKFYLFFNPGFTLFKFKPKNSDTEYGIGWLPLGGYVKLAGMIDESMDTEHLKHEPQPWEFRSKPAWQRLIIMSAGVIMNLIAAMVIYSMMLYHYGEQYVKLQDAYMGMDFSEVAKEQGFRDGDILLSADGEALESFDETDIRKVLNASQVKVLRDGKEKTLVMTRTFMQDLAGSRQGFASFRYPFIVQEVMEGSAAGKAGLAAGDSLVSINGTTYPAWSDFAPQLSLHRNDSINVGFYRNGVYGEAMMYLDSTAKMGVWVRPYTEIYPVTHKEYGFWESFPAGIKKGAEMFAGYGSDFKIVFTKEGMESLGGFGSITSLFPDTFYWGVFWYLTAYLSVILAFMNLLPIPGLDGGHIIFLLYEMITRRKLSQKFMIRMQQIGLFILLFLMLYANGMDIFRALQP